MAGSTNSGNFIAGSYRHAMIDRQLICMKIDISICNSTTPLVMCVGFRKILLQELKICISACSDVLQFGGRLGDGGQNGFSSVICGDFRSKV
jgi:hypothetical protein